MDDVNWPELARDEMNQRIEEGFDVSGVSLRPEDVDGPAAWKDFVDSLEAAPKRADYPYVEPSDLPAILTRRRSAEHRYSRRHLDETLNDRILGGWLGRCAGCLLGKPVEGWDHERIRDYMELAGMDALDDYLPVIDQPPEKLRLSDEAQEWLRGRAAVMPRDDDTDYTILGLTLLEAHGLDITTADIASGWLTHLPYFKVYTAERAAYRNLVNGLEPPDSAVIANPYREWIGAQIRADMWGYVAPGAPSLAAELAWRDARLSHTKNGIYGEMFVAATLAAAFVAQDPEEALYIGISEIPDESRLSEAVRLCLKVYRQGCTWEDAYGQVRSRYGSYHWIHTINNACLVVLGLLYGEQKFGRTVGLAVYGGWDTDCNAATAGSILGVLLGSEGVPTRWRTPLNDSVRSCVVGFDGVRISELARRTATLARQGVNH